MSGECDLRKPLERWTFFSPLALCCYLTLWEREQRPRGRKVRGLGGYKCLFLGQSYHPLKMWITRVVWEGGEGSQVGDTNPNTILVSSWLYLQD